VVVHLLRTIRSLHQEQQQLPDLQITVAVVALAAEFLQQMAPLPLMPH
jgi:hypothetical protein